MCAVSCPVCASLASSTFPFRHDPPPPESQPLSSLAPKLLPHLLLPFSFKSPAQRLSTRFLHCSEDGDGEERGDLNLRKGLSGYRCSGVSREQCQERLSPLLSLSPPGLDRGQEERPGSTALPVTCFSADTPTGSSLSHQPALGPGDEAEKAPRSLRCRGTGSAPGGAAGMPCPPP